MHVFGAVQLKTGVNPFRYISQINTKVERVLHVNIRTPFTLVQPKSHAFFCHNFAVILMQI